MSEHTNTIRNNFESCLGGLVYCVKRDYIKSEKTNFCQVLQFSYNSVFRKDAVIRYLEQANKNEGSIIRNCFPTKEKGPQRKSGKLLLLLENIFRGVN